MTWRGYGASPFGSCLRLGDDDDASFETFDYRPPYIPEGVSIPIPTGRHAHEPMIFINTMGIPPAGLPDDARQPLDHPNGARTISHVRVDSPHSTDASELLLLLTREGFVSLDQMCGMVGPGKWNIPSCRIRREGSYGEIR